MIALDRRLLQFIRPHRSILILALLCMVVNALATGFYAYLIGPVVKFLFAGGLAEGDSLSRMLMMLGIEPVFSDPGYLLMLLPLLVVIAAMTKGLSQFGRFYLMGLLGERSVFALRRDLLTKLHKLPAERFEQTSSADFVTRLGADVVLVQEAITNALGSLISDSLKVAVLLAVAVFLDWHLAFVTLIALPLIAIPIVYVGRRLKQTAILRQDAQADMIGQVQEDISASSVIRSFGLDERRNRRFEKINRSYFKRAMASFRVRAFSSPLMELMGALGLAGTLWLAGFRMMDGSLVSEHFISFFAAILMLYEPLKNLGRLNTTIQSGRAGAARSMAMLEWQDERELDQGSAEFPELSDGVVFEQVSFRRKEKTVLHSVSFTVEAGSTVALVGPSGAGKTTLGRLLLRQYEPDSGMISVDGVKLSEIKLDRLRRSVAMVEQRPVLFDENVIDNIRLVEPDAARQKLDAVIEKARLRQVVDGDFEGTTVGEAGSRLSEGERQRVALARVFLRDPKLVVFDEVTSALDAENEVAIVEAIKDLSRHCTVLLIAHRLSTIRAADKIVVLDHGRVVEQGKPEELLERRAAFHRLFELQSGESDRKKSD